MKILCLQHTENPGHTYLPDWSAANGHVWESVIVETGCALPNISAVDCLIVLGGPMSAWEDDKYPWLTQEKHYIESFLATGKPLLGVCLGAQLLADVLGANTYQGPYKEIGWFLVQTTPEGRYLWPYQVLPSRFETFLWHADTFDIPGGGVRIAGNDAFENLGFIWRNALALQFHLEVTPQWASMLVNRDAEELVPSGYVQSAETVLSKPESLYRRNNLLLDKLLTRWLESAKASPVLSR